MRILNEEEKEVFMCGYFAFKWDFKAVKWSEDAVEYPVIGPLSTWLVNEPGCILPGTWMSDQSWANCPQRGDPTTIDSLTDKTRPVPLRKMSQRMIEFEMIEGGKAVAAADRAVVEKKLARDLAAANKKQRTQ